MLREVSGGGVLYFNNAWPEPPNRIPQKPSPPQTDPSLGPSEPRATRPAGGFGPLRTLDESPRLLLRDSGRKRSDILHYCQPAGFGDGFQCQSNSSMSVANGCRGQK